MKHDQQSLTDIPHQALLLIGSLGCTFSVNDKTMHDKP